MSEAKPCGNCHSCKKFNGRDGNGYQPCHRPIPPEVATPPIQIIDSSEPSNSDPWTSGFYLGALIGFGLGLVFMKILLAYGL